VVGHSCGRHRGGLYCSKLLFAGVLPASSGQKRRLVSQDHSGAFLSYMPLYSPPHDSQVLTLLMQMLSLLVAELTILMLPWDVANSTLGNSMPLPIMWRVVLIISLVLIVIVIPFTSNYYGASDKG
jgi:hypothetical protein